MRAIVLGPNAAIYRQWHCPVPVHACRGGMRRSFAVVWLRDPLPVKHPTFPLSVSVN